MLFVDAMLLARSELQLENIPVALLAAIADRTTSSLLSVLSYEISN